MRNILGLYFSLYSFDPPEKSALFYRVVGLVFLLLVVTTVGFGIFLYEDDGTLPRIYFLTIFGTSLPAYLGFVGEGMESGAFGDKLRRYGMKVRVVSRISAPTVGIPSVALILGIVLTGAGSSVIEATLVAGGAFLAFVVWSVVDTWRRYRRSGEESPHE